VNALGQLPGALWQVAVGFSGDTRPLRILGTSRSVSAARNVRIAAIPLLDGRRASAIFLDERFEFAALSAASFSDELNPRMIG